MKLKLQLIFILTAISASAAIYTGGHADIGVAFEDEGLHIHFHAEHADIDGVEVEDVEYHADEVTIQVPSSTTIGSDLNALGATSGSLIYYLHGTNPGHELPFLGLATEELDASLFPSGVTLSLGAVTAPGEFALWENDGFGNPVYHFSSVDSSLTSSSNTLSLSAQSHYHYTYGFSALGTYSVELTASGVHSNGTTYSETETVSFSVVPEPSTYALISGIAAIIFIAFRRRK